MTIDDKTKITFCHPHANRRSLQNTNSVQHWPSPTMRWPVFHTTHGPPLSSKFVAPG